MTRSSGDTGSPAVYRHHPLGADATVIPWVGFNLYDDLPEGQAAFVTVGLPHAYAYLTASDPGDVEIYQQ
jgi:hypothetical protein